MKKSVNRQQGNSVSIAKSTLEAIKLALFSKGGIDLSPIVRDLSLTRDSNVVGIQLGLMMMGYSQEPSKATRYTVETNTSEYYPKLRVMQYDYISSSIIDSVVKCTRTCIMLENNAKCTDTMGEPTEVQVSLTDWEGDYYLTYDELLKTCPEMTTATAAKE